MSGAMRLLRCKLGGGAAQVAAQVRGCAATQKGAWLLGAGWSPKAFAPTVARLDALVPDRPAFLTTEDGFVGWANGKALDAAVSRMTAIPARWLRRWRNASAASSRCPARPNIARR